MGSEARGHMLALPPILLCDPGQGLPVSLCTTGIIAPAYSHSLTPTQVHVSNALRAWRMVITMVAWKCLENNNGTEKVAALHPKHVKWLLGEGSGLWYLSNQGWGMEEEWTSSPTGLSPGTVLLKRGRLSPAPQKRRSKGSSFLLLSSPDSSQ